MSEILQTVTLERIVSEPGVISITYDYRIPDNLTGLGITFGDNWTEIRTDGFEINGKTCKWQEGYTQRPSIELKFKVDDNLGAASYVDTGEWAITRLPNIGWSWRYRGLRGEPELKQQYDIVGKGAISGDGAIAYLGPYRDYTKRAPETNEEFRLVVPRDANLRDDPSSILEALTHASEYLDIGALNDSVLAIAAPTTAQNWAAKGTQRGNDGFWVRDDAVTDETNETWVHEYVHTRQRFNKTNDTYWFQEGTADYFAALAALERGDIEFDEFRQFLTWVRDQNAVLIDTSTWRSNSTAYRRGRRACAALDEFIREESDGASTLMDVLAELNRELKDSEEAHDIEVSLVREAIDTVTGRHTGDWFRKYVHSPQVPDISTDPSTFRQKPSHPVTEVEPEPEPVPEPDPTHRCPICDKTTTEDYCPVCGHQFIPDASVSDSQVNECPVCEQQTTERFCPICGYAFESPTDDDDTVSGGSDPELGSVRTCPVCNTITDAKFCPKCGHDMDTNTLGQTVETPSSICPICDTETADQLCPTCGHELK